MSTHGRGTLSTTVVVCTRDRPAMLARLLASIRTSAPGVDVLVVDSASMTPETRRVAEEASCRYLRVDCPGLSIARNAGLRAVTSDLVAFTDDDCIVRDAWTEPLVEWFDDLRVGVVTGEMLSEDAEETCAATRSPRWARRTVEGLDLGHGANMAFRRTAVLDVGGFDERLGAGKALAGAEDLDMFCRLLHAGWVGVREPRSAVVHAHTRLGVAYTRLMRGYAMGSGAALAKMLRLDPTVGAEMAWVLLRRLATTLLRACVQPEERKVVLARTTGLVLGFLRGLALPVSNGTFHTEAACEDAAA